MEEHGQEPARGLQPGGSCKGMSISRGGGTGASHGHHNNHHLLSAWLWEECFMNILCWCLYFIEEESKAEPRWGQPCHHPQNLNSSLTKKKREAWRRGIIGYLREQELSTWAVHTVIKQAGARALRL